MPSTDAPNWWADVQQEREDLAGSGRRPADDWLGEEIDFLPRRRLSRAAADEARATTGRGDVAQGADHPLHGVFVPVAGHAPVREAVATSRTIELTRHEPSSRARRSASASARTIELTTTDEV